MINSARDVHVWAYYDLLDDLVRMGARDALPQLKKWAKNGCEDAALAVQFIERGQTEVRYDIFSPE